MCQHGSIDSIIVGQQGSMGSIFVCQQGPIGSNIVCHASIGSILLCHGVYR